VDEPDSCSGPARAGPHMFDFPGSQVPIPEGSQVPTRETERIRCPRSGNSGGRLYRMAVLARRTGSWALLCAQAAPIGAGAGVAGRSAWSRA